MMVTTAGWLVSTPSLTVKLKPSIPPKLSLGVQVRLGGVLVSEPFNGSFVMVYTNGLPDGK